MKTSQARWLAVLLFWGASIGYGFYQLTTYAGVVGEASAGGARWPAQSRITRTGNRPSLVLFAHPRCACSRATVAELARLLPSIHSAIDVNIVFALPTGFTEETAKQDLWKEATALPGVTTQIDSNGSEIRLFGAKTSGQVFLYGAEGTLLFEGGITPARGHEGNSRGRAAILAVAHGEAPATSHSAVFGCSLEKSTFALGGSRP